MDKAVFPVTTCQQFLNQVYRLFTFNAKNKAGNLLSDSQPKIDIGNYTLCPAFIFFTSSMESSVISAISSNEYFPAANIR